MKKPFLSLLASLFLIDGIRAEDAFSHFSSGPFESIIVFDQGRMKPLDTLARTRLLQFSGRSRLKEKGAVEWFAGLFFEPERAYGENIFKINHPGVLHALGLSLEKKKRYSFDQLRPALSTLASLAQRIAERERREKEASIENPRKTPIEQEILGLNRNVNDFFALSTSLRFALPRPEFIPPDSEIRRQLGFPPEKTNFTYLDLMKKVELIKEMETRLIEKISENTDEQESQWRRWIAFYFNYPRGFLEFPIHLLPLVGDEEIRWLSPWEVLAVGNRANLVKGEMEALGLMAQAYRSRDRELFDRATKTFKERIDEHLGSRGKKLHRRVRLEVFYNSLDPLFRAKQLYGLAGVTAFLSLLLFPGFFIRLSLFFFVLGWVFNTSAIVLRIFISGRPPITNLFETFVFVSAASGVMGFFMEAYHRKGLGIAVGAVAGLVLLWISGRFGSDKDTIQVLQAVLDSNFWLSTHVVAINLGYAGVVMAGIAANFCLIRIAWKGTKSGEARPVMPLIYGALGFGLIFTCTGTILGGIWADQSWGRFWGWDPKENGALMIVLWCAFLFHARLGGWLDEVLFAAGSAFGILVVLFAWFGINLMGVGLHSYGFIDGVFAGLVVYSGIQMALIFGLLSFIYRRKKRL